MPIRVAILLLAGALLCAGAYALGRANSPSAEGESAAARARPVEDEAVGAGRGSTGLPPNHPAVFGDPHPGAPPLPESDLEPAITWKVPEGWVSLPNPNPMRVATYRVPGPSPGSNDAEMIVARAGGTPDANIQRWLGQFEGAGRETRGERVVAGFKITVVEMAGTYTAGPMMSTEPAPHRPGWALLAAIVETPDLPYFFKLVGPQATLQAAHPAFDALVNSIVPARGGGEAH